MIAVSSFKPAGESDEVTRNQIAAKESWELVFDTVYYFNKYDPKMAGQNVVFVPWDGYPRIYDLCDFLGNQPGMGALVNADIRIGVNFRDVEKRLLMRGAQAAVSSRYEFDPAVGSADSKVVDQGLDFFAAKPDIWQQAADVVPCDYRIGHPMFDTWLIGFLNMTCKRRFFDITNARVIFHPKHGGRKFVHEIQKHDDDPVMLHVGLPPQKI